MPACSISRNMASVLVDGPKVQTILARAVRMMIGLEINGHEGNCNW